MLTITNLKHGFLFVFLCAQNFASSQSIIFSENMGDTPESSNRGARVYSSYKNSGIVTYDASSAASAYIVSNSNSSSTPYYSTASGGNFLMLTGNTAAYFSISNINISGATNIKLQFGMGKSAPTDNGNGLTVEVFVDGVAILPVYRPTIAGNTATWTLITPAINIPNGNRLSIKLSNTNTVTGSYRIDDIALIANVLVPVTFGNIEAVQTNNNIKINWTTLSEKNNSYFDIEVSKDGKQFRKIATIQSKAVNGNADYPLHYEYSVSLNEMATLAILPVLLGLFVTGYKRRQNIWLSLIAICMIIIACNKQNVLPADMPNRFFVRIAQADVDGTKAYSKIVLAIKE